jgi:hypothetical protein
MVSKIVYVQYILKTFLQVATICFSGILIKSTDPRILFKILTVFRIWDVYTGSRILIFPSRIQGQKDSESRIRIRIKEFYYF